MHVIMVMARTEYPEEGYPNGSDLEDSPASLVSSSHPESEQKVRDRHWSGQLLPRLRRRETRSTRTGRRVGWTSLLYDGHESTCVRGEREHGGLKHVDMRTVALAGMFGSGF